MFFKDIYLLTNSFINYSKLPFHHPSSEDVTQEDVTQYRAHAVLCQDFLIIN